MKPAVWPKTKGTSTSLEVASHDVQTKVASSSCRNNCKKYVGMFTSTSEFKTYLSEASVRSHLGEINLAQSLITLACQSLVIKDYKYLQANKLDADCMQTPNLKRLHLVSPKAPNLRPKNENSSLSYIASRKSSPVTES